MTLYLLLDLLVVAAPIALSFDRKVFFVQFWPSVLLSSLIVGIPFLAWDVLAAGAGIWGFDPAHAGRAVLLGLPLGELLFFLVVPFSCLFVYEVLAAYLPGARVHFPRWLSFALAAATLAAAVWALPRGYTAVVFAAFGLFFLIAGALRPRILLERTTWLYLAVCFIPFGVVNGVLTSVPVVLYNPADILGPRVFTIPMEDFFYSFAMLGFLVLVHGALRSKLRLRGRGRSST